jgi:cytoskeletal protein RodZ
MEKTENTPDNIEETYDHETVRQLGQLLQSYREKVGMDIDQAADALCLTTGTLEALENEDFHLLPEAPYIRGYLRGYAKLADVSSAEAIALYESLRGGSGLPDYKFTPSKSEDYTSSSRGVSSSVMKFAGVFAILLLLVILSMIPGVKNWATDIWAEFSKETVAQESEALATNSENDNATNTAEVDSSDTEKEDEASADDTSSDENAGQLAEKEAETEKTTDTEKEDANKESVVADQMTEESNEQSTEKPEVSAGEQTVASLEGVIERQDEPSVTPDSSEEKTVPETTSETSSQEQGVDGTAETDTPVQTGTDTDNTDAVNQNAEDEAEKAEVGTTAVDMSDINAEAGEVAIRLVFEDEVWMRIKKQDGKQVFEGLRKAGETHELKSVKPLNFKVGNALGVKIYINGQLYDQKPHQRGVVSRFDLE